MMALSWPIICTVRCCRRSAKALAAGGVLSYATFARGNEWFGRPHNPDFLLRPGELLDAFAMLTVMAFEQGEVSVRGLL
jgi:hypothetical protein